MVLSSSSIYANVSDENKDKKNHYVLIKIKALLLCNMNVDLLQYMMQDNDLLINRCNTHSYMKYGEIFLEKRSNNMRTFYRCTKIPLYFPMSMGISSFKLSFTQKSCYLPKFIKHLELS